MRHLLYSLAVLVLSTTLGFSNTQISEDDWVFYFENDKCIIKYKKQNCEYEDFFNQDYIILELTNKTNDQLEVSWNEERWYDNICSNCEQDTEEYRKTTMIDANQILVGQCNFHSNLKIFSNFSEKLEDMPGVNRIVRLTKFELKNITINE